MHECLLKVEKVLKNSTYFHGDSLTETDIRLFTTLIRFDPVYCFHFKCNLLRVGDCPNIMTWLGKMCSLDGIKDTINMVHIKVKGVVICRDTTINHTNKLILLGLCHYTMVRSRSK